MTAVSSVQDAEVFNPAEKYDVMKDFTCEPFPQEMEAQVQKPLNERMQLISSEKNVSHYRIDGCLNITGPSDAFREAMVKYWQNLAQGARLREYCSWVVIGGGIALGRLFPLVAVAAAISVGIFNLKMAGKKSLYQSNANIWTRMPYNPSADIRANAYRKGFLYLMALAFRQSADAIRDLHPSETLYLYDKYRMQFCAKFLASNPTTDQGKTEWIYNFLSLNPFSPAVMKFQFNSIPDQWKTIVEEYNQIASPLEKVKIQKLKETAYPTGPLPGSPTGLIGITGIFKEGTYSAKLEQFQILYQTKLQEMMVAAGSVVQLGKQRQVERLNLKCNSALQAECFVQQWEEEYFTKLAALRNEYDQDLKNLKGEFNNESDAFLETRLEQKFAEAKEIFSIGKVDVFVMQYDAARALLEKAQQKIVSEKGAA